MNASIPHRVAITGIGPITAVGIGKDEFWNGLKREQSPMRGITRFDASPWKSRIAAEVDDFNAIDYMDYKTARKFERFTHFSIASARLALGDANLDPSRHSRPPKSLRPLVWRKNGSMAADGKALQ